LFLESFEAGFLPALFFFGDNSRSGSKTRS
jgi:hypothetical protein